MPIYFQADFSNASRGIVEIARFPELARGPIRDALRESADELRTDVVTMLRPRAGGRASLPGEPPASQTGRLVRSLRARVTPSRGRDERAYVLAPEFYAFMLESGTRRIRPRPFMVPAAQANVTDFVRRVEHAVEEAIQQTNRR